MTVNALAIVIIAGVATFVIAAFAIILMIRDYASKHRWAKAEGNKAAREVVKRPMTPVLDSHVKFQVAQGIEHDAIVISVHNPRMISLVIVDNDDPDMDQYFRDIERGASIARVNLPPVHRFSYG